MFTLKSCPFCGNEARLSFRKSPHGAIVFAKCSFCEAQGRSKLAKGDPETDSYFWNQIAVMEAANLWNMRVSEPAAASAETAEVAVEEEKDECI